MKIKLDKILDVLFKGSLDEKEQAFKQDLENFVHHLHELGENIETSLDLILEQISEGALITRNGFQNLIQERHEEGTLSYMRKVQVRKYFERTQPQEVKQ